ncbi:MAG: DNA mismatch repair endonuclease MutL [Phycisphaerales bacterium]|nr:DNA mismatch repair endonuclease MutL [Phycisphaerales bacterium]
MPDLPPSPDLSIGPIKRLPPVVINQIAAGEVIERPASVLKELVENALDAGSTKVSIELERGGIELIRVSDDGRGIAPDELPLAIEQHATSKISIAEDLDTVATLGFRGEALASIGSVSRLTIRSRRAQDGAASEIAVDGGVVGEVRPASGAPGTVLTVRTLFYNTPARRKFLRTPATEQGRCVDWLKDLAMARPGVGFRLVCDGRVTMDLPPGQGPRTRAIAILGKDIEDQLVEAHLDRFDDARGVMVWGLCGLPTIARATARSQHVFVNGRAVRDKTIQHALREAYRGLIEPGRHPTAVLMIEMSPDAVDVNVHPAKLEVRFRDQSMVHQGVLRAVREALRSADLTPQTSEGSGDGRGRPETGDGIAPPSTGAGVSTMVEFLRSGPGGDKTQRLSFESIRDAVRGVEADGGDASDTARRGVPPGTETPGGELSGSEFSGAAGLGGTIRPTGSVLQVHKSYLVTQDEQGILIIDQHALHERVMYERLYTRVTRGELESQRLLTPAVIGSTPRREEAAERIAPLLEKIGVRVEPMGPVSLGVHAFPTLLFERGVEPGPFVEELLDRAAESPLPPGSEEALHEVLDMMACKAAVKAGDRMAPEELDELLRQREMVERSSNCPHGRPTSVRLTIRQLERMFGRS